MQPTPAAEEVTLLGATELISQEKVSPDRVKDSQAKCPPLEDTLAPLGDTNGLGGDSSAPIGLEAKIHLLIKNTDPAQLALLEERLDNSASNILDDWCKVKKKKKNHKQNLPPLSHASTRSRVKADIGSPSKGAGRKNLNQILQEETRRNLADGSQRSIKDFSGSKN